MQIRIEEKYGTTVFVSVPAEQGRVDGCLCVRKENGQYIKCANLLPNSEYERRLKENIARKYEGMSGNVVDSIVKKAIKNRGVAEMGRLSEGAGPFADDGVCRAALINYAVCLANNIAMGVSRCPRRKTDELMNWYRYVYTAVTGMGMHQQKALFESYGHETVLLEIVAFDKELIKKGVCGSAITSIIERGLERGKIVDYEFRVAEKLPLPQESMMQWP